jgi:hypothetical protein
MQLLSIQKRTRDTIAPPRGAKSLAAGESKYIRKMRTDDLLVSGFI